MIQLRRADQRGRTRTHWLDSRHSFSFGQYVDPEQMGFRALRVINDDRVAPGGGFGTHPHKDMEILTYVLEGALEHKDSMGNRSVIRTGELQRMSAGTGIEHSEFNHSATDPVHFLQMWILPWQQGLEPSYEQLPVADAEARGRLHLVASPDGTGDSLLINQDARILITRLEDGETVTHDIAPERHVWLQVAKGAMSFRGLKLEAGDGAAVAEEPRLTLRGEGAAEVLLFDLG